MKPLLTGILIVMTSMTSTLASDLDDVATRYVRLVHEVGQHDPGYVDAYYGPEELKPDASAEPRALGAIASDAASLLDRLDAIDVSKDEEIVQLRKRFLMTQIRSLASYVEILGGKKLTFDEESKALYDAVAPTHDVTYFKKTIDRLDAMLPGEGPVSERLERFMEGFTIPPDKLDAVFTAAIDECRRRTAPHIELPEGERFDVEYVTDKPWSGYNWYKGKGHSLIQVNTDLPIRISRAIDLACHEGYPGHHVYNALLEHNLVDKRGWVEFSVYPLFSPQSLIAEGSANFGIDVAFPADERVAFEKEVLFPMAGLDPTKAELYYDVNKAVADLGYAGNEAARQYLNGEMDREQTVQWLVDNALASRKRAEQRVRFYDTYRSYVINYNLGQDLVRAYVNSMGGTPDQPEVRWKVFTELLSSPRLPSDLSTPR